MFRYGTATIIGLRSMNDRTGGTLGAQSDIRRGQCPCDPAPRAAPVWNEKELSPGAGFEPQMPDQTGSSNTIYLFPPDFLLVSTEGSEVRWGGVKTQVSWLYTYVPQSFHCNEAVWTFSPSTVRQPADAEERRSGSNNGSELTAAGNKTRILKCYSCQSRKLSLKTT